MNEFKFSCPHCQRNIQATPEYVGLQINCPNCQASIVVPNAPGVAAPNPGKLHMTASTVQHAATSPVMAATMIRKSKKPRYGLYIGLGVGVAVAAAAVIFVPKLIDKYHEHQEAVAAAKQAAENPPPPPPPPDLSADEILKNLGETYKKLPSYGVQGEMVGTFDLSQLYPTKTTPETVTAKLSLRLGRPDYYRLEWEKNVGAQQSKGAAWSAGQGDFVHTGPYTTKMANWQTALGAAGAASGSLGGNLVGLFFDATNSVATTLKNYSKKDNETLDGRKCYVLAGQVSSQNVLLWIHKNDFLIAQAEIVLGGKLDDAALASLSAGQRQQAEKMSKIKGSIIETYVNIETNKVLNPGDFQMAFTPSANPPRERPEMRQAHGKKSDREQAQ